MQRLHQWRNPKGISIEYVYELKLINMMTNWLSEDLEEIMLYEYFLRFLPHKKSCEYQGKRYQEHWADTMSVSVWEH